MTEEEALAEVRRFAEEAGFIAPGDPLTPTRKWEKDGVWHFVFSNFRADVDDKHVDLERI